MSTDHSKFYQTPYSLCESTALFHDSSALGRRRKQWSLLPMGWAALPVFPVQPVASFAKINAK